MQVEALTPLLEVVPGRPVIGRIRVVNDTTRDTIYHIRVVGIDAPAEWRPVGGGAVPAGTEVHIEVPIQVPDLLGTGQHPVGVEVTSDQVSERSGLASFTVSVESVADVVLRAEPSIIRGSTRGKFRLDIENRESTPLTLELVGGATDITAKFKPAEVHLNPGERASTKGKLQGRRRWSGDPEQHFVTLTARGRSSSTSITTRFVQRSMFPWKFRRLVALLVVLALWLAGAAAYVWYQNDKKADEADRAAAEQELLDDADASSDGSGSATDGSDGDGADAGGSNGPGGAGADAATFPTETTFGGAVTLADGADPSAVKVSLDEIPLGQAAEGAQPSAFAGGRETAKIWPARYGSGDRPGIRALRQTETVRSVDTTKDGTWKIGKIALRRNYEVVFSRSGYNTQSFVVTPPEDGAPVELEIEMQPGIGVVAGVVRDSSGALGGVTLVATDGDLSFATTSSTDAGKLGEFSFNGLNTPAVYSITASRSGYGTEVVQFGLAAGQARAGEIIEMRKGVGSITGTVLAKQPDTNGGTTEQPFGGVTITVTNGDLERTVTTLTEGAVGTFSVPRLPIPGTYTVTASVDGYSTASLTVDLTGARSDAVLRLVNQFAVLGGLVVDDSGLPVSGAGITLTRDDVSFSSNTVSDENATAGVVAGFSEFLIGDGIARLREMTSFGAQPGEFRISDLPAGEYRIEILHFAHEPYSATVVLKAGDDQFLSIALVTRAEIVGAKQSLRVFASENGDRQLEGVKFWLRRPGQIHDRTVPGKMPAEGNKIVTFENLELGTYILRAELENYRTNEILVSVGATAGDPAEIKLRPFGNVVIRIVDSISGDEVNNYGLRLIEVRNDSLVPQMIDGSINPVEEQELNGIVWSTGLSEDLSDGIWRIEVRNHPDGYLVLDQDIIFEPPIVDNVTESLQFEVRSDSRPTIDIKLRANALPNITVRAYHPPTSNTTPAEVTLLGGAELTVELRCGPTLKAVAVADALLNGVRTGIYRIPKELLESPLFLTSTCQIAANGPGYQEALTPLVGLLQVANETTTFDRQVSTVMVPRAVTVTGRVSWFDGVEDVFLPDTPIRSTAPVTTGYQATQTVGDAIPDKPFAVTGLIEAVWADDPDHPGIADQRSFTISGQVFDSGFYQISYPDDIDPTIAPGTVKLSIPVAPAGSALTVPNSATTALASQTQAFPASFDYDQISNTYDYNVKLRLPESGKLQGCLSLRTVRPAPNIDEIIGSIWATPLPTTTLNPVTKSDLVVGCPADPPTTNSQPWTQGFELVPATAGQWSVDYVLPGAGWYQYDPNVAAPPPNRVDPRETQRGFDRTLVENGTINLTIDPGVAVGYPQPALDTNFTITPYVGYSGPAAPSGDLDAATSAVIRGVPVAAGNPYTRVRDLLNLTIPGYDVASAAVDSGGNLLTGAAQIPVDIQAGEEIAVVVGVDPMGLISGSVAGYSWLPGDLPESEFGELSDLTVSVRRVMMIDGSVLGTFEFVSASDWVPLPQLDSLDFRYSNVPGYYEFKVEHPDYRTEFVSPTGDRTVIQPGGGSAPPLHVFEMANSIDNRIAGDFGMQLNPATLDVNLWSSFGPNLDSRVPISGSAQMRVVLLSTDPDIAIGQDNLPNADPVGQLWTLAAANPTLALQPGNYRLEIFKRVGIFDLVYPVSIEITLDRSGLRIDATLPSLSYELWVTVKVVNQDWQPDQPDNSMNRLPVPAGIQIGRSWDAPGAILTGASTTSLVANDPIPGTDVRYTSENLTTAGGSFAEVLKFEQIPSGEHDIEVLQIPEGYTIKAQPGTGVPVPETSGINQTERVLILEVADIDVVVNITNAGDQFPEASKILLYDNACTSPAPCPVTDGGISVVRTVENPQTITITGLPPRRGPYTLRLDDELHVPEDVVFFAQVDTNVADTTPQQVSTTLTADVGRIEGLLRIEDAKGACDDFTGANCSVLPAGAVLQDNRTGTLADYDRTATLDSFRIDLTSAATVRVVASNGLAYTSIDDSLGLTLGRVNTHPVVLRKKPVVSITLTNPPADATVSLTTPTSSGVAPPEITTTPNPVTKTWSFLVLPGVGYQFTADALRHYPLLIPTDVTMFDVGTTNPFSRTLERRTVTVEVTKPAQDGLASAQVNLMIGSEPFGPKTATFVGQATKATVVFGDSGPLLPLLGTATATASATGYRTASDSEGDEVRAATIRVTILPDVTVTGLVRLVSNPVPQGTQVLATRTSPAPPPGDPQPQLCTLTTNAFGRYSFKKGSSSFELCPGATGDDNTLGLGSWTISSSATGWGTGSNTIVVGPTTPSSPPDLNVSLTARSLLLTIDAKRPGVSGAPVALSSVNLINGGSSTNLTVSGNVVTLTEAGRTAYVMQTRRADSLRTQFTYTMVASDFNGTPPFTATTSAVVVYAGASFGALVRKTDTQANPEKDVHVWLLQGPCPSPVPDIPNPEPPKTADNPTKGEITLPATVFDPIATAFDPAGTNFCLVARKDNNTKWGSVVLTVSANGSGVLTIQSGSAGPGSNPEYTIVVPIPAPPVLTLVQPAPVLQTDADGSADISAGDTLRFTITATNGGTANLTNVVVTGALPSPDATTTCTALAPAATCVVTFDYVVAAGDVGSTISSDGQATSTQVNATPAPRSVVVPAPSLTLTMPAPTPNDLVVPVGLSAGDTLTYTLTATAAGTANLSNVVVSATVTSPTGRTLSPATPTTCTQVLSGATCVLVVTYTIIAGDSGQSIVVQASATSTQATVSSLSRTTPIP